MASISIQRNDRPAGAGRVEGRTETLYLYGVIGADFMGDGITSKSVLVQLQAYPPGVGTLEVRLNSAGGDVFEGFAIFNALARYPAHVVTYIDGMAWSIASVIAMAGAEVIISGNAQVMIHNPAAFVFGEAADLRKTADLLDMTKDSLIGSYQRHANATAAQLSEWMDAETWFNADQAVEYGFATRQESALPIAACYPRAMRFRNMPAWVHQQVRAQARPRFERRAAQLARMRRDFFVSNNQPTGRR